MDRINHNNYPEWIERFLNAETTLAEERELYAYFSRPDLPEEARRYRSMFGWYEELPATQGHAVTPAPASPKPVRILPLRPWQWAGVAAVMALLFTLGLTLRHSADSTYTDDDYIYASYVILDGKKITDPEVVRAEFDRMESKINNYTAAIDRRMGSRETPDINIETDNPEIRNFIKTSFKF